VRMQQEKHGCVRQDLCGVAQTCSLLITFLEENKSRGATLWWQAWEAHRRLAGCQALKPNGACDRLDTSINSRALQVKNLRYSRLKVCATPQRSLRPAIATPPQGPMNFVRLTNRCSMQTKPKVWVYTSPGRRSGFIPTISSRPTACFNTQNSRTKRHEPHILGRTSSRESHYYVLRVPVQSGAGIQRLAGARPSNIKPAEHPYEQHNTTRDLL